MTRRTTKPPPLSAAATHTSPVTHYQALGIEPTATIEQIRSAYRRAAKRLHPDVSGGSDAQAKFAEVARAYEVLSDQKRRREYDLALRADSVAGSGQTAAGTHGRAHYTWSNVGSDAHPHAAEPTDLDEMYETFFGQHKPAE